MNNNKIRKFPKDFYNFLDENTLVEIKAGKERKNFTEIWMVRIGERVFARSWNKNSKGWMNEFLKNYGGKIKYGEKILNVNAKKIEKTDRINAEISDVYVKKYTQDYNIEYARGISHAEYYDYTIEFLNT